MGRRLRPCPGAVNRYSEQLGVRSRAQHSQSVTPSLTVQEARGRISLAARA